MGGFAKFPEEILVTMQEGCTPGHRLTPGCCLDIESRTFPVPTDNAGSRSARYRLVDPSKVCAACGLPFVAGESQTFQSDGTRLHAETNPDSMRRCREGLLARLRSR